RDPDPGGDPARLPPEEGRAERSGGAHARLMPLWDRLRGLELDIEEAATERSSVDVSTQFTRVTTTVVLRGGGHEGRGEDVTYTAEDHGWFPRLDAPGSTTLALFSSELDELRLFESEPQMAASVDYRR